jgi:hypothetical protein
VVCVSVFMILMRCVFFFFGHRATCTSCDRPGMIDNLHIAFCSLFSDGFPFHMSVPSLSCHTCFVCLYPACLAKPLLLFLSRACLSFPPSLPRCLLPSFHLSICSVVCCVVKTEPAAGGGDHRGGLGRPGGTLRRQKEALVRPADAGAQPHYRSIYSFIFLS